MVVQVLFICQLFMSRKARRVCSLKLNKSIGRYIYKIPEKHAQHHFEGNTTMSAIITL
jgi:hypothetical protein